MAPDELLFNATLPLPPSVNNSLAPCRVGKAVRLVKSPEARAWAAEAARLLAGQPLPEKPLQGPLVVDAIFWVSSIASDGGNRLKPLEDALTAAGVWGDDRQVVQWRLEKRLAPAGAAPYVDVDVRSADPEEHAELAARLAAAEQRAQQPRPHRTKRPRASQAALPGLSSASYPGRVGR